MCGIAGLFERAPGAAVDGSLVERMQSRLLHRGPDGTGTHLDPPVALGHTRLAILDIPGGHQPMISEDGATAIVYNGEVYNFRELRRELEQKGHRFRTTCDTEVVLAAYREWGDGFVRRLNGMFAFGLWDRRRARLLLGRDRLGIKPLFVWEGPHRVAFASEIKALLEIPELDRSWDSQALHDYFAFLYVPTPRTAYRAIRQVPPGTLVSIDREGVREERWWELRPQAPLRGPEALERVTILLEDAVRLRTIADVPIGAFLSGGIDSGLVVAFMSRAIEEAVRTFTVYDPEIPYYDERVLADQVARAYRTEHHELVAATEVARLVEDVVPTFDEPFADSGVFPNLVVCRETRRLATVALSGLGGDEISGGYERYRGLRLARMGRVFPNALRGALVGLVDRVPEGRGLSVDRAKRLARLLGLQEAEVYTRLVTAGGRLPKPILSEAFQREVETDAPLRQIAAHLARARDLGLDAVNRLLYTDLLTYIPGDLLPLADRTSMRFGLEVRVPFLDHRLVETALGIPGSEKLRFGQLKRLLRRIAKQRLPADVLAGPKRGFSVPMAEWLRTSLSKEMALVVEDLGPETGVLDREGLRAAWEEHRSGRANHEEVLWAALVFTRWATSA